MIQKFNFEELISEYDQDQCIKLIDHLFETDNWHKESPPFQTHPNLFEYSEIYKFEQSFIFSCFSYLEKKVNYSKINSWCYVNSFETYKDQNREDLWHKHPSQVSGIYYLRNPKNISNYDLSGTEFQDETIPNIVPEDFCWYIYPSDLIHRPGIIQSNQKRYVLAADFYYD